MVVLDTNALVWLAQTPDMLSKNAQGAIREARTQGSLVISDKSLWEVAMIVSNRQIRVMGSLGDFLQSIEKLFLVLPINAAIAERSTQFSSRFPKDPSDRIIAATALVHGMPLVTADVQIRASGEVPTIW